MTHDPRRPAAAPQPRAAASWPGRPAPRRLLAGLLACLVCVPAAAQEPAQPPMPAAQRAKTLRLLTWNDFTPAEVIAQFERESGFKVQVVQAGNDEMIARLRDTTGDGFDLAQPSQDRVAGAQKEHRIYRPLDLARVKVERFHPVLLEATKKITTIDGKVYGLPHIWGTDGLVVNHKLAPKVADYADLCRAEYKGKTAMRLWRPTLLAFAAAGGKDPFALYGNRKAYSALMDDVTRRLQACKANVKFFWESKDRVLGAMRTGELVAATVWDRGGWTLNAEQPDFRYLAPRSGALGWIDGYALPATARNDEAAYAWINFNLRPDIAAKVARSTGNLTAIQGAEALADDKRPAQYAASFSPAALKQIRWYAPAPAWLDEVEARAFDRIREGD